MIVSGVLRLVSAILGGFFSLLPSWSMPSWLSSGTAFPSGLASTVGGYLHVVAPFIPVDLMLTILGAVFSLWPAIIGYLVFQWVWNHIPEIAGFGTH